MARVHRDLVIRGVIYPDADAAAAAMGVSAMTIRSHARAGTLDRCGLGLTGGNPGNPVKVRGRVFASGVEAARHFGVNPNSVWRRLNEGRPEEIGLPNQRGIYRAKSVVFGPLRFRSMAEASRALGFSRSYVSCALRSGSPRMRERIVAAAMELAGRKEAA